MSAGIGAGTGAIAPTVLAGTDQIATRFASAAPFRHVVIDDFFEPAFAEQLLAQFPAFEHGEYRGEDGRPGGKSTFERLRALGDAYARLDDVIKDRGFLDWLGRVTGIDGLLYDPWYLGGGTHENRQHAGLTPHIDFNFHPLERWQRRLNLIVYLNPEWQREWGGALDLYLDPKIDTAPAHSVVPVFNRCVIFETHGHSWHGFDNIRLPPERAELGRKSIALYFYTPPDRTEAAVDAHSTVYVHTPLPTHLRAGHILTDADLAALHSAICGRDQRIDIQYQEISRLMALVRAHERGPLGSVLFFARKAYARLRRRKLVA